jgi:hypothetical protein
MSQMKDHDAPQCTSNLKQIFCVCGFLFCRQHLAVRSIVTTSLSTHATSNGYFLACDFVFSQAIPLFKLVRDKGLKLSQGTIPQGAGNRFLGRHLRKHIVTLADLVLTLSRDSAIVNDTIFNCLRDPAWEVRHAMINLIPRVFESSKKPKTIYAEMQKSLAPLAERKEETSLAVVRTHVCMFAKIMDLAEERSDEGIEAQATFMLFR